MHEYYFKIRKGDIEFEFSTSDKNAFEQQLSDWINGLVKSSNEGNEIKKDENMPAVETEHENSEQLTRSGFIDVKNLASINEMQSPSFEFSEKQEETPSEPGVSFEDALNDSIQNPKTEVVEKTDPASDFEEFLKSYNPESQIDYLIITALYILNVENQERFTIKQLNAKLVPLTGKPVDHAVMQEATESEYVKVVPDLTGTSEFTEYTLTEKGEGYFVL